MCEYDEEDEAECDAADDPDECWYELDKSYDEACMGCYGWFAKQPKELLEVIYEVMYMDDYGLGE